MVRPKTAYVLKVAYSVQSRMRSSSIIAIMFDFIPEMRAVFGLPAQLMQVQRKIRVVNSSISISPSAGFVSKQSCCLLSASRRLQREHCRVPRRTRGSPTRSHVGLYVGALLVNEDPSQEVRHSLLYLAHSAISECNPIHLQTTS